MSINKSFHDYPESRQRLRGEVISMTFDNIVTLISSVGFPIAVSVYMIVSVNKTMEQLKDSIDALRLIIEKEMIRREDK